MDIEKRKAYMKAYHKKWYEANKAKVLEKGKEWALKNPERSREIKAKYASQHIEEKKIANLAWQKENPEKVKIIHKRWVSKNLDKVRQAKNARNKLNPEPARKRVAAWNAKNPIRRKEAAAKYRKENQGKIRTYQVIRRSASILATPKWANEFYIDEIYNLAKLRSSVTGFAWDVDHIVPIQSKLVCGLHVESNMQVIPSKENKKKSNRHWPDMP